MTDEREDSECVALVRTGDVQAFEVLVRRYQGYVCSLVIKYLSREYVEEVSQEVFVEAFQSIHTFRGDAPFRSWLSTIAIRTCYAHLRQKYKNREISESQLTEGGEDWCRHMAGEAATRDFDEGERRKHAAEVLTWAMEQLGPEDRMVMSLLYLEDRSVRDAAQILGWGVPKVKVRAFRARKVLRGLFDSVTEKESR